MKKRFGFVVLFVLLVTLLSCSKNAYCPSYSNGTYNNHFKSTLPHYQNKK